MKDQKMRTIRKLTMYATVLSVFALPSFAGFDHDGNETPINVRVVDAVSAKDGKAIGLTIEVENPLSVAVVLRGIADKFWDYRIQKKAKLFGNEVWSDVKLYSVSPRSTEILGVEGIRINIPSAYVVGKELLFEADFGPKGHVVVEHTLK
jgi:hypothetical protein